MLYLALRLFFFSVNDIHDHDHAPDMKFPEYKQIQIRKPEAVHVSLSIVSQVVIVAAPIQIPRTTSTTSTSASLHYFALIVVTRIAPVVDRSEEWI
jgi:hypothetical protein